MPRSIVLFLVAFALSACGGGGGGNQSAAPPSAATVPAMPQTTAAPTATPAAAAAQTAFASSPYNMPLPANPQLDPNSANIVAFYFPNASSGFGDAVDDSDAGATLPYPNGIDFDKAIYHAAATDPLYTVVCAFLCPSLSGKTLNLPANMKPPGGSDGHIIVYSPDGTSEADFYAPTNAPGLLPAATVSPYPVYSVDTGAVFALSGNGVSNGPAAVVGGTAASLGIIRGEEVNGGVVAHALFLVLPCSNGTAVYPSIYTTIICAAHTNAAPLGTRFFLTLTDAQINALTGMPTYMKPILFAMAHYGLIYGDSNGPGESPGLQIPSTLSYASAQADPWYTIALNNGSTYQNNRIDLAFNPPPAMQWNQILRVAAPCVTQAACTAALGTRRAHP